MTSPVSPREQEVLQLIAFEHSSKEIARQLFISEHTVISHRKNLIAKLNVKNTAGLVRRAFEAGYLKIQTVIVLLACLCTTVNVQTQNTCEVEVIHEIFSKSTSESNSIGEAVKVGDIIVYAQYDPIRYQ